jgi:hypothetical protein
MPDTSICKALGCCGRNTSSVPIIVSFQEHLDLLSSAEMADASEAGAVFFPSTSQGSLLIMCTMVKTTVYCAIVAVSCYFKIASGAGARPPCH